MSDDATLLLRYARQRDNEAFAAFVSQHLPFVYSCALRRAAGDAHLAQDIAQEVFVVAARESAQLAQHPVPAGWLYTTARNVAARIIRGEIRRRARECEVAMTTSDEEAPLDWERLRPALDEALDALDEDDRRAILLRFFENRSFSEVGARLRLADNAARMRVNRALERMSAVLRRHGITSTAAALATTLAAQPTVTVPATLAGAIAATAAAATATATVGTAAAGALFMSSVKLPIAAATAVLLAGSGWWITQAAQSSRLERELADLRQDLSRAAEQERRRQEEEASAEQAARRARSQAEELERLRQRTRAAEAQAAALRAEAPRRPTRRPRAVASYDGTLAPIEQLQQRPIPKVQVPPSYPERLRTLGVPGEAVIQFVVDPEGKVRNAAVLSSSAPEFGEAAIEAIEAWEFEPGVMEGTKVATQLQIPLVFTLNNGPGAPRPPGPAGTATPRPAPGQHVPWF